MMDMVRKHCVEGSGNWKMAQACVDRTHGMVRDFKKAVYSFVSQSFLTFNASSNGGLGSTT